MGVAVVVWKDGKILIGKDLNKEESEVYALPGGHLEDGESYEEAGIREVWEEAGVSIFNLRLVSQHEFYNTRRRRKYKTIGFEADWNEGNPRNECSGTRKDWFWCNPDQLPCPMFKPDVILVQRTLSQQS